LLSLLPNSVGEGIELQRSPDAETHYRVSGIILANSLADVFGSLKFIKRKRALSEN
jgi:hypothetical protein